MGVDHEIGVIENDCEFSEQTAIGHVVGWPNNISILSGIELDADILCAVNAVVVSTDICDSFLLRTRIWSR